MNRNRIKNEIFREEVGIENLLIKLEKKQQQWYGYLKRMDKTRIPTRASELNVKIKRPMG
jgi:hypothetical protein